MKAIFFLNLGNDDTCINWFNEIKNKHENNSQQEFQKLRNREEFFFHWSERKEGKSTLHLPD